MLPPLPHEEPLSAFTKNIFRKATQQDLAESHFSRSLVMGDFGTHNSHGLSWTLASSKTDNGHSRVSEVEAFHRGFPQSLNLRRPRELEDFERRKVDI